MTVTFILTVLETGKFKIKALADSVSCEHLLLAHNPKWVMDGDEEGFCSIQSFRDSDSHVLLLHHPLD